MANKPSPGEVFRYPFLWKRQELSGETEGRKKRPVRIAVTVARKDGETVVFILPITTQPPRPARHAIEVPEIESQRVGLETHVRKWIMLDEVNTDIVERSYVWDGTGRRGAFWWHRIVVPGPVRNEYEDWHDSIAHADARGDIPLLLVKGAFILFWPVALGIGWLAVRLD